MPADVTAPPVLEVHLEELGEHSWVAALFNTLGGSYGSAQYRFVARPARRSHRARDHEVTGTTFPVMRLQDLDDRRRSNAWIELAEQRLEELDRQLRDCGWTRLTEMGEHWWSRRYGGGDLEPRHVRCHVIPGP